MQKTAFYSYKGCVGRTLAFANFGIHLAKTGQNVAIVDIELEAPGLNNTKLVSTARSEVASGLLGQFFVLQSDSQVPDRAALGVPPPAEIAHTDGERLVAFQLRREVM